MEGKLSGLETGSPGRRPGEKEGLASGGKGMGAGALCFYVVIWSPGPLPSWGSLVRSVSVQA